MKFNRFYGCCETGGSEELAFEETCGCGKPVNDCTCVPSHTAFEETCGCGNPIDECGCSEMEEMEMGSCGCGASCGCGGYEDASDSYGCGSDSGCGSGCGGGCGCGGGEGQSVRIAFEDGTEYDCPVLSIFDINEQEYIALYHPEKQKALLYRFKEDINGIFLEGIDDETEFELVARAFQNL